MSGSLASQQPQLDMMLHGPLYGIQTPSTGYAIPESRVLSVGPLVASSQQPTFDVELLVCRALWNTRQPINTLPTELMVDIFMCLPYEVFSFTSTSDTTHWFQCMNVCRHWRAVIRANPCFWRTIRTGERTHWLQLALSRSGEANLRLRFVRATGLITALPNLLPRRERIERLDFTCQTFSDVEELAPLISAPLPCLTEFSMSEDAEGSASRFGGENMFVFQPENFPALAKLSLVGASLPWTGTFLSRLRSLHLRDCRISPTIMSLRDILDVVWCGVNLEELTLHGFLSAACSIPSNPADAGSALVTLLRLRKLDVSDTPAWISRFLAHVRLPSQGDATLTGQIDSTLQVVPGGAHASLLASSDLGHLHVLRSAQSATLVMLDSMYWIVCQAPGPLSVTFQLRARTPRVLWVQSLDDGLKHSTQLLRAAPLTALTLQCELMKVSPGVLAAALDAFEHLHELTIASSAFGPDLFPTHLCDALRTCEELEEGSEKPRKGDRVRCPSLKTLRLVKVRWEDGAFMNAISDCLRERERLGAPRLELLEITASRSPEVDWSEPDTRFADIFRPVVGMYEFSGKGW